MTANKYHDTDVQLVTAAPLLDDNSTQTQLQWHQRRGDGVVDV